MPFNRAVVFPAIAAALGKPLTAARRSGLNAIFDAWERESRATSLRQLAYVLATPWHETNQTLQPIAEYGGNEYKRRLYDVTGSNPSRARLMGNTAAGDGVLYAGRGYVQLTWKVNYERAGKAVGVDLVTYPDLAMEPEIAARILVVGMVEGWFTGKKLSDYITGESADYRNARRIINGTDQADKIAAYATRIEAALRVDADPPLLREGMQGAAVAVIQSVLGVTVDDDFGPATKRAVMAFQSRKGLESDGVVGRATWAALKTMMEG
ncbi:peptidoglycan-binding protein [Segnochrobactraceae bacterium EtOH-i3]